MPMYAIMQLVRNRSNDLSSDVLFCFLWLFVGLGIQMQAASSLVCGRKVEFNESCDSAAGTPEGSHGARAAAGKF